jgi:hypothetical protein
MRSEFGILTSRLTTKIGERCFKAAIITARNLGNTALIKDLTLGAVKLVFWWLVHDMTVPVHPICTMRP